MKDQKVAAIIQARMGSSRLPGKVLRDIGGRSMLGWVVERTRQAQALDQVLVATTVDPADQPVVEYCEQAGYLVTRGDEHDVLDRYYQAACTHAVDVVVRITADCPLIDPRVIDKTVETFLAAQPSCDFAANRLPPPWGRTYPIGLDTEVCSFEALEQAWREADQAHQREHVMPYLYEHPDRFQIQLINHEQDYGGMRWTVDTAADLALVRQIVAHFQGKDDFSWLDVLELMEQHPELQEINAHVEHKHVHDIDERG